LFPCDECVESAFVESVRRDSEFVNFSQGALEQMESEFEEFRPGGTEFGCAQIAPEDLIRAGRPLEID
jgi:hypothetical protein